MVIVGYWLVGYLFSNLLFVLLYLSLFFFPATMDARLTMDKVIVFKKIIEIIDELIDHVTIVCTKTKLEINLLTVDLAAMASISLMGDFFTSYRINEEIINFNVHVKEMCKILKYAVALDDWETLQIKLEHPNSDFISFILLKTKDTFKMRLMDIQGQNFIDGENPIDWEMFNYKIEMSPKEFTKTCDTLKGFSDVMRIHGYQDKLYFHSDSDGSAISKYSKRYKFRNYNTTFRYEISSRYSSVYMKKFSQFFCLSEKVVIGFPLDGDNKCYTGPIMVYCSCPDNQFIICLVLGAKIDSMN